MEKDLKKKPVVFFDLETTGKDKNTNNIRILELVAIKYEDTDNWKEIDRFESRFNNGDVPIDPGAIEVHGIKPEDVKDLPTFHERAHEIFEFFDGCDVGGYNNSFFDNSVLFLSFKRAGITWDYRNCKVYDILNLYRKYHSAKLTHVYKYYTGKELEDAHYAGADIEATVEVYKHMQKQNEDFEGDELDFYKYNIDLIGDFKWKDVNGEKVPYYNFSQHIGKTVEEVGIGMLDWMQRPEQANKYPEDTIQAAKHLQSWLEKRIKSRVLEREQSGKTWYDD